MRLLRGHLLSGVITVTIYCFLRPQDFLKPTEDAFHQRKPEVGVALLGPWGGFRLRTELNLNSVGCSLRSRRVCSSPPSQLPIPGSLLSGHAGLLFVLLPAKLVSASRALPVSLLLPRRLFPETHARLASADNSGLPVSLQRSFLTPTFPTLLGVFSPT